MAKTKSAKKIAIITGASAGLGKEFALQIEQEYLLDEIWLLARRTEPMREVCEQFTKSKGVVLSMDLTSEGDMLAFQKKLSDEAPEIMVLVNNAGYGKIGPFQQLGLKEQLAMIDLNIRALTELTYVSLPYIKSGSLIIQVASSLAYCPAPYMAVYGATKSYVLSFSEALNFEFKDKGIHVIAVCPGPVETEFFAVAQKNEFTKDKAPSTKPPFAKSLVAHPKDVVEQALKDARKKKPVSIFGFSIKLFASSMRFMPKALAMNAMASKRGN